MHPIALPGVAAALFLFCVQHPPQNPQPQDPQPQDPQPQDPQPQDPQPQGHLVLVVEGDVTALRVTAAVAKKDPCGAVPKGLKSRFRVTVLDSKGKELCSRPLDLSAFDTDPAHIGQPVRSEGCQVRDWRIALLVNVPDFPQAAQVVFYRDRQQIGAIGAAELRRMSGGAK